MTKKILIIAPHPDDEVLGCGAYIGKCARAGHHPYVLIITRGTPKYYSEDRIVNVRKEALEAHNILGVKETRFLEYHAPELDQTPISDIANDIVAIIRELKIDTLFLPHRGDIHNDHSIVFKAGLVAARPVGQYSVKDIYCYETLSETEWAAPFGDDAFIPTFFTNVEDTFPLKLEAMKCFKSQLRDFPNPRSLENLTALAKFRGATVGVSLAEAFMHIRSIEN